MAATHSLHALEQTVRFKHQRCLGTTSKWRFNSSRACQIVQPLVDRLTVERAKRRRPALNRRCCVSPDLRASRRAILHVVERTRNAEQVESRRV
jgi:hypothetical protein